MYHGSDRIRDFVPGDESRQVSSKCLVGKVLDRNEARAVLDLGCGAGGSESYFRRIAPTSLWVGIDIAASPEVDGRTRKNINLCTYDGIHLPIKDNTFDLVYFHQVLEHVREPYRLIKEIGRIIKPGGFLVGSVSHLEPFHSLSVSNFTPYGLALLLGYGGMRVMEMRPGIDVLCLLIYRASAMFLPLKRYFSRFFERESPVNRLVGTVARLSGKSHQDINLIKLLFCGQFRFLATKDGS
jgi:SAM-dependent methyltransferase